MQPRFPRPLVPGATIGITAPSSGLPQLRARLDVTVAMLRERGYAVRLGECLGTPSHVSAPRQERAAELMAMLTDPDVAAVVPPWGGKTGIDLLPLLDLDLLSRTDPCWYVGLSDTVTTMLPLLLRAGWVTLHGSNAMDTPYAQPAGLLHWLDVAEAPAGTVLTQRAATHRREPGWDDYEGDPQVSQMSLTVPTRWRVLGGDRPVSFSGPIVGGCLEVLSPLAGTSYGDVRSWAADMATDVAGEGA